MSDPRPPPEAGAGAEDSEALRRDARRGFAVGAVLAAAVFANFALLPGTTRPLGLYVGLAVVLGVSIGLLATVVLVVRRVRRLGRDG